MKKLVLALAMMASTFATSLVAQNMSELCGTTDWNIIDQRLIENRRVMEAGLVNGHERMTKFVPIKFHLIGQLNGAGRLSEAKVFENLCQLNKDYQPQNIIFYMADGTINYINDNNAFNNQSNQLGAAVLENARSQKAVNIYFAQNTPSSGSLGGTTLGYYSPQRDWLVIRNDQVNATSGTLSHELGHYFTLKHVFSGWDQKSFLQQYGTNDNWASILPWFKIPTSVAPDGSTLIECFNGNNCKTAGDRICDTPADYNFGFGWDGCNAFTRKIIGPCPQDSIKETDEENFMGYFIGCKDYKFTKEQQAIIAADYNFGVHTAKIRSNYAPAIETIDQHVKLLTPSNDNGIPTLAFYDFVNLDWEDMPKADGYLVEIDRTSNFAASTSIRIVTKESKAIAKNLEANKSYFWRVIPFDSEGGTCLAANSAQRLRFTTSSFTIAANDIEEINTWTVAPNPVVKGNALTINVEIYKNIDANVSLYNSIGQVVKTLGARHLEAGMTTLEFDTADLSSGTYFVTFQNNNGTETKRVVVE